ncbi:MAG: hypothetical protein LUH63_18595 [Parabacteroides sp.]|nr:hypothetical protein [Parabacteroides sp.]
MIFPYRDDLIQIADIRHTQLCIFRNRQGKTAVHIRNRTIGRPFFYNIGSGDGITVFVFYDTFFNDLFLLRNGGFSTSFPGYNDHLPLNGIGQSAIQYGRQHFFQRCVAKIMRDLLPFIYLVFLINDGVL